MHKDGAARPQFEHLLYGAPFTEFGGYVFRLYISSLAFRGRALLPSLTPAPERKQSLLTSVT